MMTGEANYHDDWEIAYAYRDDDAVVVFFFDWYNGKKYANLRRCIEKDEFRGPTKLGIKFACSLLPEVLSAVTKIKAKGTLEVGYEVLRVQKNRTTFLTIRVEYYQGRFGIDFRNFMKTARYTGYTKQGIRIGYEQIRHLITGFQLLNDGS